MSKTQKNNLFWFKDMRWVLLKVYWWYILGEVLNKRLTCQIRKILSFWWEKRASQPLLQGQMKLHLNLNFFLQLHTYLVSAASWSWTIAVWDFHESECGNIRPGIAVSRSAQVVLMPPGISWREYTKDPPYNIRWQEEPFPTTFSIVGHISVHFLLYTTLGPWTDSKGSSSHCTVYIHVYFFYWM